MTLTLLISSTSFHHIDNSHAQPAHESTQDAVFDPHQQGHSLTAEMFLQIALDTNMLPFLMKTTAFIDNKFKIQCSFFLFG